MATLKSILVRQAAVPANIEQSIPGIPKVSSILAQLATAIPIDPVLPDFMAGAAIPTAPTAGVTQVIKGIEDALPVGVPKLSQSLQVLGTGGYRAEVTPPEKMNNSVKRVMGDGYRSI